MRTRRTLILIVLMAAIAGCFWGWRHHNDGGYRREAPMHHEGGHRH